MTSTLTLALRARNANRAKPRYQICLIHPFDPRGEKVGGLETYLRDFITFHPADTDLLFIGVDSAGDLKLGEVHRLTFRGRTFDFLPLLKYSDLQAREATVTTVDGDIRFLGSMPDEQNRDIYGAADFFCLTGVTDSSGRVEGFALVYPEAAAGGAPGRDPRAAGRLYPASQRGLMMT